MRLIINADDFGLSKSISDGIVEGIKKGYITSTTVMANMPYAEYAINQAIENNINCIGLHINLTVGKPIIKNDNLTDNNGVFYYNKSQIENKNLTYEDAYNEIIAQIEKINEYSKGKIKIDHLDAHHFLVQNNEIIKKAAIEVANKLNIPLRNEGVSEVKCPDVLYTNFTIENVNVKAIRNMISLYKDKNMVVELAVHPGYIDEYTKTITSYIGREKELKVLKEAKEKGFFNGIELINFSQF